MILSPVGNGLTRQTKDIKAKTMNTEIKQITVKELGKWDGPRWLVKRQYRTDSVNRVRSPSRAWPYSEFKHVFTKKYRVQLSEILGYQVEIVK